MFRVLSAQVAAGAVAGWALAACATAAPSARERLAEVTPETPAPVPSRVELAELPEPDGPVETRRSDGVRVLRADAEPWFASLPRGRYAVPLGRSHGYRIHLPHRLEAFGSASFHPPLGDGRTGTVLVDGPLRSVRLPVDPCRDHTYRPVGRSAAALAEGLARQPFVQVSGPRSSRVGPHPALELTVAVPRGRRTDRCPGGRVGLYAGRDRQHPWTAAGGYVGRFWVLEVAGERFVVRAETTDDAPPRAAAVLDRLVDSIRFTPSPTRRPS